MTFTNAPGGKSKKLDLYDYPVFDSLQAAPAGVWKNPRLIVEKFIAGKDANGHYVLRNWFFLGDQGFTRSMSSPYHIVKPVAHDPLPGRQTVQHYLDEPLHPAILELRKQMGFDYGRFDYVMVGGEPVVFDTNMTPVIVEEGIQKHARQFLEDLPRGLLAFL